MKAESVRYQGNEINEGNRDKNFLYEGNNREEWIFHHVV